MYQLNLRKIQSFSPRKKSTIQSTLIRGRQAGRQAGTHAGRLSYKRALTKFLLDKDNDPIEHMKVEDSLEEASRCKPGVLVDVYC